MAATSHCNLESALVGEPDRLDHVARGFRPQHGKRHAPDVATVIGCDVAERGVVQQYITVEAGDLAEFGVDCGCWLRARRLGTRAGHNQCRCCSCELDERAACWMTRITAESFGHVAHTCRRNSL